MNILYVVWWEGVHDNPLLHHQVYDLLGSIRHGHGDIRVTLLSGGAFRKAQLRRKLLSTPILKGLVPGPRFSSSCDTAELARLLAERDVPLVLRDTLVQPRTIYLRAAWLLCFPWFHLLAFRREVKRNRIDVVHCRSYSAAWLALLCRSVFRLTFRLVFDVRGLLPEEGVCTGAFSRQGRSYALWKKVECRLLARADAVVSVCHPLTQYLHGLCPDARIETIPLSVSTAAFPRRTASRSGGRVLAYLGTLSRNGWHTAENLAELFALFSSAFADARLLVVSANDPREIRRDLVTHGVPVSGLSIVRTPSSEETAAALSRADYGALPFSPRADPSTLAVARTMLAVKSVEYLAAGLPLICHEAIGGAGALVRHRGLGVLFGPSLPASATVAALQRLDGRLARVSSLCVRMSRRFDIASVTSRYVSLYRKLAGPGPTTGKAQAG